MLLQIPLSLGGVILVCPPVTTNSGTGLVPLVIGTNNYHCDKHFTDFLILGQELGQLCHNIIVSSGTGFVISPTKMWCISGADPAIPQSHSARVRDFVLLPHSLHVMAPR